MGRSLAVTEQSRISYVKVLRLVLIVPAASISLLFPFQGLTHTRLDPLWKKVFEGSISPRPTHPDERWCWPCNRRWKDISARLDAHQSRLFDCFWPGHDIHSMSNVSWWTHQSSSSQIQACYEKTTYDWSMTVSFVNHRSCHTASTRGYRRHGEPPDSICRTRPTIKCAFVWYVFLCIWVMLESGRDCNVILGLAIWTLTRKGLSVGCGEQALSSEREAWSIRKRAQM